jgi:hypothetical protein
VFGEDVAGGVEAVECGGEAGVNGHLDHYLDNLLLGPAHVQGGVKMRAKLRLGATSRNDGDDGGNFARFDVEARAGLNIAKDELGDVAGHVRRNAGDIVEGLLADVAHHLFQSFLPALVSPIVSVIISVIISLIVSPIGRHEGSFG